jgi:hypothetical protein
MNQNLSEGLGSFIKNIATGDIEDEINEIRKEIKDIHTPEQQRFVITKIVRLLERLVILRHNPTKVQTYVHDSVLWFQKHIGSSKADPGKEMALRVGEAIADLSKLRDQVLAKKWSDEFHNQAVDKLKEKVDDLVDRASKQNLEL